MRKSIAVAISVAIIVSAIASVILLSATKNSAPQKIEINLPKKSYSYQLGFFSLKNKPMLYLGANTRSGVEGTNYSWGTFYIAHIHNKIKEDDWKEILKVHKEIERIRYYSYRSSEYFSIILSNLTSLIVKINENLQVEKIWYVRGLEIHSMLISNGYFYLFGKNGSSAELVRSQNLNNFTEIYKIKNVVFIFNSYLFTLNNEIYLAYGVAISNLSSGEGALLKISETGCKEIVNNTQTWEVFAFSQNNKIFYYETLEKNINLLVINPFTDKIEGKYNIYGVPFYHNNGTTVAIGKNILYSENGINFKSVCSRNNMNFDIISPDQIIIVNNELYVLLIDNDQSVIMRCRI